MSGRFWPRLLGFTAALSIPAAAAAQGPVPDRSLSQLRGIVYRAVESGRTTVVLVAPEGIVVVDPLNFEFAQWLKGELDQRFTGRPVTHVIYSRVDFDRIGGASAFNSTAEIVGAEGLGERLRRSRDVLPPSLAPLDVDKSTVLESGEVANIPQSADVLRRRDLNDDGQLTPNEVWNGVPPPEAAYGRRRTVTLGGTRIELIQEPGLGDDATMLYVPSERLLFSAAFPDLATPFTEQSGRPSAIATWARRVASLEFETLLTGTGDTISYARIEEFATYVTALVAAVSTGYERGQSLDQLRQGTSIARFPGTPFASRRDADIGFVYRRSTRVLVDATGALVVNTLTSDRWLCEPSGLCQFGPESGIVGTAAIGVRVMKRWRFTGELTTGRETDAATSALRMTRREVLISALAAFQFSPSARFNVSAVGGPTFARTHADVWFGPTGMSGRPNLLIEDVVRGFTFGADLAVPLGNRLRFSVPLRVTRLPRTELDAFRTTRSIQAGVGLDVALWKRTF
jgi:glyoxylase-like metal-dependent hydrolase (beta-lactamase superfamily II)